MWQYNQTASSELYHYGVLGMKWGHHKPKIGTIKTHKPKYKFNPQSKHQQKLKVVYIKKGMKVKEAENAAAKRAKIEKTIAITGGLTVAAAAATVAGYSLKKQHVIDSAIHSVWSNRMDLNKLKDEADIFIPNGNTIGRVSSRPESSFKGDRLYTYVNKNDGYRYKTIMPTHLRTKDIYDVKIKTLNDVKAPSSKKQFDLFSDMLSKNENGFATEYVKERSMDARSDFKEATENSRQFAEYRYRGFMTGIISSEDSKARNIFQDKLKEMGYNAMLDDNDIGTYSKSPLIIMDPSKNLDIESANKVTRGQKIVAALLAKDLK